MVEAQKALEQDPQDMELQVALVIAKVDLKEFLAIRTDWIMEIAQQKWLSTQGHYSPTLAATFKQQ